MREREKKRAIERENTTKILTIHPDEKEIEEREREQVREGGEREKRPRSLQLTLQHTATHCIKLKHTATHCTVTHTPQHTATHCNTL